MEIKPLDRMKVLGASVGLAIILIAILSFILKGTDRPAKLLLDLNSDFYPFTIHNLMYVAFFLAFGELFFRNNKAKIEKSILEKHLLPEDEKTLLQPMDLWQVRKKVLNHSLSSGILPEMINRCILQFQTTKSIAATNNMLNSLTDIHFNKMESSYSLVRYLAWAIPTFGFIGTVMGIGEALKGFKGGKSDINFITGALSTAFDTTFLALILSAILMFFIHTIYTREETILNETSEYCLNNLINKLYSDS